MNKIKFLFDIPRFNAQKHPLEKLLLQKEKKEWKAVSSHEFIRLMDAYSERLLSLGVKKGDKIAIMSSACIEWNLLDLAIQQIGGIVIPIFPNMIVDDYKFILKHSESRFCFVENDGLLQSVSELANEIPSLEEVFHIKLWRFPSGEIENSMAIAEIKQILQEDDIATIIYTSGTGGDPKGVMLTHRNMLASVFGGSERIPGFPGCRVLSFLPISHVYERMMIYLYMYMGYSVYYAESLLKIADNVKEVKPHLFSAVPRFIEKVYEKFIATGGQLGGFKKIIFSWSIRVAERFDLAHNSFWYKIKLFFARKLVLSKFKQALGGEIITISSASATLPIEIARVFFAANIPIMEGYGLTETSPTISVSYAPDGVKLGTTGPVLSNIEIRISEESEIWVKGDAVMKGYYKLPELSQEVFTPDGWFKTGDLGEIIDEKFLKIVGRKNTSFKLSNGKFIHPEKIESLLANSVWIDYALIIGENEKQPSAVVFIAEDYVIDRLKKMGEFVDDIYTNSKLLGELRALINSVNKQLNSWEKIADFKLLPIVPNIENGMLTPTLKLKRSVVINYLKAK